MFPDRPDRPAPIAAYIDWARNRKGLRPLTMSVYENTLDMFTAWCDQQNLDLLAVTAENVEDFAGRVRRNGRRPAAATARRDIVTLRQFYGWAQRKQLVPVSDVVDAVAPRVADRTPKPIDDDLWRRVWLSNLRPDDRLWLGLGYFAGLRRYEIATIPPDAVQGPLLRFERKGGSTQPVEYIDMCRAVQRHRPWVAERWEEWVELVERYGRNRLGERFLWPHSTGWIRADVQWFNRHLSKRILPSVGIVGGTFTPHHLRHSCATNLLKSGVEPVVIADLLSHASVSTTMRYMKTSGQLGRMLAKESPDG